MDLLKNKYEKSFPLRGSQYKKIKAQIALQMKLIIKEGGIDNIAADRVLTYKIWEKSTLYMQLINKHRYCTTLAI